MAPPVLRRARSLSAVVRRPEQQMPPYFDWMEDSFIGSGTLVCNLMEGGSSFAIPVTASYGDELQKMYDFDLHEPDGHEVQLTLEEIDNAIKDEPQYHFFKARIINLGRGRLVKYGSRVTRRAALVMQYLRRHSNLPIPRVHAFFQHLGNGYLVMDHVDGKTLSEIFPSLDQPGLDNIAAQLGGLVEQIRSIPRPLLCPMGAWPEGPYRNQNFSPSPPRTLADVHEFNKYWFCQWLLSRREYVRTLRSPPNYPWLENMDTETYSVFGHGDLGPTNIMVKDGKIASILDWETASWYPHWWEFVQMRVLFRYPFVPYKSPTAEAFLRSVLERSLVTARIRHSEHDEICQYGEWVDEIISSLLR